MLFALFLLAVTLDGNSAPDYLGIAAVLTAGGLLVTAVAGGIATIVNTRRIRTTEASTVRTESMVKQIDHAVNGKPPGASTMVSQVQDLHNQIPVPVSVDDLAVLPLLRKVAEDLAEVKGALKDE